MFSSLSFNQKIFLSNVALILLRNYRMQDRLCTAQLLCSIVTGDPSLLFSDGDAEI